MAKARLAAATRRRTQAAPAGPHGPAAPAPSAQAGGDPQADRARRIEELFKQVAANLEALRRGECCGLFSGNYDPSRTVTVSGTVVAVQWLNPQSIVFVNGTDGNTWGFTMASPNTMIRAGMNKNSLRPGDQVLVNGYPAKGTAEACPGPLPNSCEKFDQGALHASATTIVGDDGRVIFDRLQGEQLEQRRLEEQQRQLEQDLGRSGR